MNIALPDANVTGYESLIAGLGWPDEDDRHVLAVAIRAKAEIIVTLNHKDFPQAVLNTFDIEALSSPTYSISTMLWHSKQ